MKFYLNQTISCLKPLKNMLLYLYLFAFKLELLQYIIKSMLEYALQNVMILNHKIDYNILK